MNLSRFALSSVFALALMACGDDSSSGTDVLADNQSQVTPGDSTVIPASQNPVDTTADPADTSASVPSEQIPVDNPEPSGGENATGGEGSGEGTGEGTGEPATSGEPADPYAVGTDIDEPSFVPEGCVSTPLENGKGDGVTCGDVFKGYIYYDTDTSAYDPASPDLSKFTSIDKVFNALKDDEKVVFVLRHAERNSSSGKTSHLTEAGIFQAQSVGKKIASDEPAYYAHSEYVRTRETLENIAVGRGETGFTHEAYGVLNGDWFIKSNDAYDVYKSKTTDGNYVSTTDWAYNGGYEDAFYDLDTRAKQFIDEFLVGIISKKARISIVATHDQFLVPLTVYASDRKINLRYFEDTNWITYLAGIAVIVGSDGSVKTLPIKGLNSGI